jgi:hypothetical protein
MLAKLPRNAARRIATRACVSSHRSFVQPSGADRASVVDVPSTYQDEAHFTPRAGMFLVFISRYRLSWTLLLPVRYAWFQVGNFAS